VGARSARPDPGAPVPGAAPAGAWPPELAAALQAVEPQVRTCFADQRARAPAEVSITVTFTPTRDGGFAGVAVSTSWQDPYLTACVEDVFDEVGFHPSGRETFAPARHTFELHR
jgi:hypothetical protein